MLKPTDLIDEILEVIPNPRTKEVIVRRFGLPNGERHTLETIGQDHGITRERVRQIEENGLAALRQPPIMSKLEPLFEMIRQHLAEYGDLKREDRLYKDLSYVCFPIKEIEHMKRTNDFSELNRCQPAFYLILTLGEDFDRLPEDDYFYPVWTISREAIKKAKKTVDSLVKYLDTEKKVFKDEDFFATSRNLFPDLPENALRSYVDASKQIEQNSLGHFGLIDWPEISPKGVKDKAYLVLKNEGRPLHFSEVTNLINQILPSARHAYIQTVHNELIKDPRFVLVGRGLYALSEWGYQPGTVADIIAQILKSEGPLTKEELTKKVLEKRLVKENTILINLQNRKLFKRDEGGRYSLRA